MRTIKLVALVPPGELITAGPSVELELPTTAEILGLALPGTLSLVVASDTSLPGTVKRRFKIVYNEGDYDQREARYIGTVGYYHVFEDNSADG